MQVLGAVAVVRLIVMPAANWGLIALFAAAGWLPADPMCKLAMLLQVQPHPAVDLQSIVTQQTVPACAGGCSCSVQQLLE